MAVDGLLIEGGGVVGWGDEGITATYDCGAGGGAGGVSGGDLPDAGRDGESAVFEGGTGRARGAAAANGLVDQRSWQTIEALAPLAVSAEEKRLARDAERLADHEVDQAFAQALRQASVETRNLTGEALVLQQKVATLQGVVKDDQEKVDSLTAAAKGVNPPGTDDLDIAKAQLQLDNDELADATEDLARVSGDNRGQIQQELTAREAAMKKFDEQADSGWADGDPVCDSGMGRWRGGCRRGSISGRGLD